MTENPSAMFPFIPLKKTKNRRTKKNLTDKMPNNSTIKREYTAMPQKLHDTFLIHSPIYPLPRRIFFFCTPFLIFQILHISLAKNSV